MSISVSDSGRHYQLSQSSPIGTAPTGSSGTAKKNPSSDTNALSPNQAALRNAILAFLLCSFIVVGLVYALHRSGAIPSRQVVDTSQVPPIPTATATAATVTPIPSVTPERPGTSDGVESLSVTTIVTVVVPYPVIQERPVVYVVQPPAYIPPSTPIYHGVVHHQGYGCAAAFSYCVRPGNTVYGLARRFGTSPQAIISANNLWDPNYIRVGQVLQIPCAAPH